MIHFREMYLTPDQVQTYWPQIEAMFERRGMPKHFVLADDHVALCFAADFKPEGEELVLLAALKLLGCERQIRS